MHAVCRCSCNFNLPYTILSVPLQAAHWCLHCKCIRVQAQLTFRMANAIHIHTCIKFYFSYLIWIRRAEADSWVYLCEHAIYSPYIRSALHCHHSIASARPLLFYPAAWWLMIYAWPNCEYIFLSHYTIKEVFICISLAFVLHFAYATFQHFHCIYNILK